MRQTKTRFLTFRITPTFEEALRLASDEYGISKSQYARQALVRELKCWRDRRHLLGLDRPKVPQLNIGNQCSAPPA